MAAASNYLENLIVNSVLRGVAFTVPSAVYVALHTGDPGEVGTANEVATANWPAYVRLDSAQGDTLANAWSAPSDGLSKNQKQLIWPVHDGAADITITHFSLRDAATGGNVLAKASLASPRTLQPGDVFVANVDRLEVQVL